jgi:hypothetical protein
MISLLIKDHIPYETVLPKTNQTKTPKSAQPLAPTPHQFKEIRGLSQQYVASLK